MQIEKRQHYRIALLHLGFRPFFLLAGVAAASLMALWTGLFYDGIAPLGAPWSNTRWHAHEMIFGYGLAVVAGFLLTATRNWTGVQTLRGMPLLLLALLWLLARVMPFLPVPQASNVMAALDLGFDAGLCLAVLQPIVKVKQWQQMGIWAVVLGLLLSNGMFYLGLLGVVSQGGLWGLYGGLYLLVVLIFLMGRRVIPFFIERGAGQAVTLANHKWADMGNVVLISTYIAVDVFTPYQHVAAGIALLLAVLHGFILRGWHTPALWRKPLLWVLYLGYGWMVLGFALRGLAPWLHLNPMLAVHAFAVGGIGMITLGMMSRVALGHTGREVGQPPTLLRWMFLLLLGSAVARVGLVWGFPVLHAWWIGGSQVLWIAAFVLFAWVYLPILIKPRIDGSYG